MFLGALCLPFALGQENTTGKIEGQVIDRQKNLPLAQQKVVLHIHQGEEMQQRETVTDDSGQYVFDNLPIAFDVHYMVLTSYEGKEYVEQDLVLSEWVPQLKVNIEIGAFTDDPSKVKIQQQMVLITPPPGDHDPGKAVSVMEIVQVENTSDLAFQTSRDGQQTGLYLNLPNGTENVQADNVFQRGAAANRDRLVSSQPLAPGPSRVGYSYVMHTDGGLDLSRAAAFDTNQVFVFVSEGMPFAPRSSILKPSGQERFHDTVYTVYTTDPTKPLSAGQSVDLQFTAASVAPTMRSTPRQTSPAQASDPKMIALIAVAAACAGGFLVLAIFKTRTPTTQPAEPETPQSKPDASWLRKLDAADLERARVARLEMITRLEDMHEKQEISDRVYNRLRKEQADRLAAVLERLRG